MSDQTQPPVPPISPSGWYPDVNVPSTERYWDGTRWTDALRPMPAGAPTVVLPANESQTDKSTTPAISSTATAATASAGTPTAAGLPNIPGRLGLIFAIVGFVFAVIPPIAILSLLFLLPALILGIVGVTRKSRKRSTSWAAIIIAVVAFILSIITYSVWVASSSSSSQPSSSVAPLHSDNPAASPSPSATKSQNVAIAPVTYATLSDQDFALLAKNPDGKQGDKVTLYGTITQFDAATGICGFLANIENVQEANSYDYAQNSLFAGGDGKKSCPKLSTFVKGNFVQISATVLGAYSYDTQIGGKTTVPSFLVDDIVMIPTPAQ